VGRVIDISLPIGKELMTWPGDPPAEVVPRSELSKGDQANVSDIRITTHTGTHIDPPLHFIEGADGIDRVPLEALYGPATVVDLRGRTGPISVEELEALSLPNGVERLLVKSDNSEIWRNLPAGFPDSYTCFAPDSARWVVDRGIRLVGVDFLSVEQRGTPGHPTHLTFLENGVVIVEGLNLGDVEPGAYTLAVLPLRIVDGDGGPARAMLVQG